MTAEGPGSEELTGYYPNTHLHEVLQGALLDWSRSRRAVPVGAALGRPRWSSGVAE